jgi:hypothetical protein
MSNATDHIPHEVAKYLWAGVLTKLEVDGRVIDHIEKMFSPINVVRPDGTQFVTAKGVQMGTPLSFMTLSLLHKFAVQHSGNATSPHIIRGDDLVGAFSRPKAYVQALTDIGMKINPTKTIWSQRGGTFTEKTFRFVSRIHTVEPERGTLGEWLPRALRPKERTVLGKAELIEDIPIKGILRLDPVSSNCQRFIMKALGETCSNIKSELGSYSTITRVCSKLERLCQIAYPRAMKVARHLRYPINAPIPLGGLGIPDRTGRYSVKETPFWYRAALSYAASHGESRGFLDSADGERRISRMENRQIGLQTDHLGKGTMTKTKRKPGNGARAFKAAINKLNGLNMVDETLEKVERIARYTPAAQKVQVHDPEASLAYQLVKRRTIVRSVIPTDTNNSLTVGQVNKYLRPDQIKKSYKRNLGQANPTIFNSLKVLQELKQNRPPWVLNKRASERKLADYVSAIDLMSPIYVPFVQSGVTLVTPVTVPHPAILPKPRVLSELTRDRVRHIRYLRQEPPPRTQSSRRKRPPMKRNGGESG